jgi:hypothetical protein
MSYIDDNATHLMEEFFGALKSHEYHVLVSQNFLLALIGLLILG